LAQLFVEAGLRYCGIDISTQMVAVAEQRLRDAGLPAKFLVADISQFSPSESFDAVVSHMGPFFTYISDPLAVLQHLRPYIRKKIILDLNPRDALPLRAAMGMLRHVGFRNIVWRPYFVPKDKKLPVSVLQMLAVGEHLPLLRNLPLRWKFLCLLKAEVE
jgi:SAM-dependent methyltransferase